MTTPTVPHRFYTALAARDWQTVGRLYADDARFDDPAFVGLDAAQVRAMWRMLLGRAGDDFRVSYEVLADTPEAARVRWTARYTFSQAGRPVLNVTSSRTLSAATALDWTRRPTASGRSTSATSCWRSSTSAI
ncbi:MAG: nuclear transport factor 2 family protein [Gemmatimonadota bacterium]|jgi:hypothetical protein